MHRRHALARFTTFATLAAVPAWPRIAGAADRDAGDRDAALQRAFEALERGAGGRLGVACLDAASGHAVGQHLDERFPMCSTFKLLLAAQVLHRVARGDEALEARVAYGPSDLQEWSPVTGPAARAGGMDVAGLCAAAITQSDNTAANLLLRRSGGPAGLTAWLRGLGDAVTRLDREEPALNDWTPGQVQDTTTPRAMATTMRALLVGDALPPASRARLRDWLRGTRTGDRRLRAGLPRGWDVGDKTGTWRRGTANDVAIVDVPGRGPWMLVGFLCSGRADQPVREAALADVARAWADRVRQA